MIPEISTTTIGLLSLSLFSIGLLIGWIYSRDSKTTLKNKIRLLVTIVIMLGWISTTAAGIIIANYSVSPMIHALMGSIVGYFFTEDGINVNIGNNEKRN
jgi:hypothetical protein